jgi:ABC-type microcin C transport system permease subunit YejE
MKIFIGIATGFLLWTILWLGSEPVIFTMVPEWNHESDPTRVVDAYLVVKLLLSVLFSLISGYVSAVIAKDAMRAPTGLGVLLFLVGLFVQIGVWDSVPVWFHSIFLGLLLPVTIIGGRLRKV